MEHWIHVSVDIKESPITTSPTTTSSTTSPTTTSRTTTSPMTSRTTSSITSPTSSGRTIHPVEGPFLLILNSFQSNQHITPALIYSWEGNEEHWRILSNFNFNGYRVHKSCSASLQNKYYIFGGSSHGRSVYTIARVFTQQR
jgi:hypothetical protein